MTADKHKLLELRKRLDDTLVHPDLVNMESISSLITDQILRSPFHGTEGDLKNIVKGRARKLSNFLDMLRSASGHENKESKAHRASHNQWKVKQDTDQFRVMYREGPLGTPFHTLLIEGCISGPMDACLCVSWESPLYTKWWPQYNIPSFKIVFSSCLEKVRIGEQISLVRVKVPWPVSDREALLHCFEIEYFKENLILVLLDTISNTEQIDERTHGFSNDNIPEERDTVQVDLLGGFVLQKVNPNQCYFRTIATMDMKLDFVPPSLINFISRQLFCSGYKLYQQAVMSVKTTDEDYRRALEDQVYARIRERILFQDQNKIASTNLRYEKPNDMIFENPTVTTEQGSPLANAGTSVSEIMELEPEHHQFFQGNQKKAKEPNTEGVRVSQEVEYAIEVIDKAITIVRKHALSDDSSDSSMSEEDYQIRNHSTSSSNKLEMPFKAPKPGGSIAEDHRKEIVVCDSLQNHTKLVKRCSDAGMSAGCTTLDACHIEAACISHPGLNGMSKVGDGKIPTIIKSNQRQKKVPKFCCMNLRKI